MSDKTKTYVLANVLMGVVVALTGILLLLGQWQLAGLLMMTAISIQFTHTEE